MERIAILTFHITNNYGAALQSYALQQVLSSRYVTEILDYRNSYLESLYLQINHGIRTTMRVVIRNLIYPKRTSQLAARKGRFSEFYKKYHMLSERVYDMDNVSEANEIYDAFIAGSDQVWNLHLSRDDWNYFLEFAPPAKRYSYAASINTNCKEEDIERIKGNLSKFQSILVRENKAVDFLTTIGVDKPVTAVCDPVFLLPAEKWEQLLPSAQHEKYVLLYTVANVKKSVEFAKKIAKENNLMVISLSSKQSISVVEGVTNVLDAGPIEFLNYIRNASYVVTSSFHAMAFSIIFNVPFYYELCQDGGNNNDRLENIASIFCLEGQEILDGENCRNKVDWAKVNKILENYRQNSIEILFRSLDEVGGNDNE